MQATWLSVLEGGTLPLRGLEPGPRELRASGSVGGACEHVEVPAEASATDVIVRVE